MKRSNLMIGSGNSITTDEFDKSKGSIYGRDNHQLVDSTRKGGDSVLFHQKLMISEPFGCQVADPVLSSSCEG